MILNKKLFGGPKRLHFYFIDVNNTTNSNNIVLHKSNTIVAFVKPPPHPLLFSFTLSAVVCFEHIYLETCSQWIC